MTDKKTDEHKITPNKQDYNEQIEKKDESRDPSWPGRPVYQAPTEPWPEKPKK